MLDESPEVSLFSPLSLSPLPPSLSVYIHTHTHTHTHTPAQTHILFFPSSPLPPQGLPINKQ